MILKSFSKIYLSLNVNKKLKNNLHDIQSYFCQIDLSDRIEINRIKGQRDKIYFKGEFAKHINKRKNSILNTLALLRKNKLIFNFYSVFIKKNIPVYAGLGGGTSNAAYLVKYFLRDNNSKTLLKFFSNKLGSDIRLFFHHQGFLKNLNAVEGFKRRYMLNFLLVSQTLTIQLNISTQKLEDTHQKNNFLLTK